MDYISLLARTVETTGQTPEAVEESILQLDRIWAYVTSLGLLEALTFVSFGAVWLFYGWRVFKILVMISFGLLGAAAGVIISNKITGENNPLLAVVLGVVMAAVSVPLMRWAVGALGAAAGGVLTAGLWYAFGLPQQYIWAGALAGVIAGGMISFIVFKIAVMLFSSLGGSILMVTGFLALLYLYPQTTEQVREFFFGQKWFLPAALMVPTLIGIYWQNRFIKGSTNWNI